MTAKERILKAIDMEVSEVKSDVALYTCADNTLYAFNQGRIFAHNYDRIVIERILTEAERKEDENAVNTV